MDILEKSANNYKRLTKSHYFFKTADKNGLPLELKIGFKKSEFTHIIGLDHLTDIKKDDSDEKGIFETNDSKIKTQNFEDIINGDITYKQISKSDHFKTEIPKSFNEKTGKGYTIQERLTSLVDIEKVFEKIVVNNAINGTLMNWDKDRCNVSVPNQNDSKSNRNSSINASYALAVNVPTKDKPNEKVYFFFCDDEGLDKKTNVHSLKLFSAFADCTDLTQGQKSMEIGTISKETQIEKNKVKTIKTKGIYQNPNPIKTRTNSEVKREQTIYTCFNDLKTSRKDYSKNPSKKSNIKNYGKAKDNFKSAYSEMPDEDKNTVISRFIDILESKNNQQYHNLITEEIKTITGIDDIEKEKENIIAKADKITNEIQSSTGDLKKNITSFALFPERGRNEQIFPNRLRLCMAGGDITDVQDIQPPQNQFTDIINKAIDGLVRVADKIMDFLSSSSGILHNNEHTQPLQDRTARGRKINLSLPFPKEKPSQERTEPVTAKSEKAQKLDFKPTERSEKKLSWIANEISSAKREANENNRDPNKFCVKKNKALPIRQDLGQGKI